MIRRILATILGGALFIIVGCMSEAQPSFEEILIRIKSSQISSLLSQHVDPSKTSLDDIRQCVFVMTPAWSSHEGMCQLWQKKNGEWTKQYEFPVMLGRNGLSWGRGIHKTSEDHSKQEGDGKGPAGVFFLGDSFGYASSDDISWSWPYRQSTQSDIWVDDTASRRYNQWVNVSQAPLERGDWESFEQMRRDDDLYEYGVIVNHNMSPVVAGAGSAIFMHVWRSNDSPTAGCTAMSRTNMMRVIEWLDLSDNPILMQLPMTLVRPLI